MPFFFVAIDFLFGYNESSVVTINEALIKNYFLGTPTMQILLQEVTPCFFRTFLGSFFLYMISW